MRSDEGLSEDRGVDPSAARDREAGTPAGGKSSPGKLSPGNPATSNPSTGKSAGSHQNAPPKFYRLHPLSLFFRITGDLRALIWPMVALYLGSGNLHFWYLLFFIPSLIYGVIRYFTVRYHFTPTELIVRQGLLIKNERHVPFQRIQNIDLIQRPLHRLCGVAEVRVETAAGKEPEATFKVLSLSAVEQMRERVFIDSSGEGKRSSSHAHFAAGATATHEPEGVTDRGDAAPVASVGNSAGDVIVKVPLGDLIRLGLISNRAFAVVAAAFGLLWEFGLEERIDELDWLGPAAQSLPGWAWFGLTLFVLSLLLLFSIGWTVFRLYGFTLEKVGEDLRLQYGLATRLSATIPRRRVQFVSVRSSWRHRLFDRVSVRVETAGAADGDSAQSSRQYFIPILPSAQLQPVLESILPEFNLEDADWQPLAKRATYRCRLLSMAWTTLWVALLGCAIVFFWRPWAAPLALLFYPWSWWYAGKAVERTRWGCTPRGIVFESGVLTRTRSTTIFEKIQGVVLRQSPFDRRHRMASVRVDTAGAGVAGHVIAVPMLDHHVAESLHERLVQSTQESHFIE